MTTRKKSKSKRAVHKDIERLLRQAANDRSAGGLIGLGATWLAAELFIRNETLHVENADRVTYNNPNETVSLHPSNE